MDEEIVRLVVMLGIPFSFAGGLTAFLITYQGYTRGQNPDKRLALKMALRTAFAAFVLFVILAVGIGFCISKVVAQ